MLKRTDIRKLAESAGLMAPSLQDVQVAADKYRKDMVATQTAREDAEEALRAAGANADDATITRLYSALAAAKTAERRAERAYHASERDVAEAQTAYADKVKASARAALSKATATYDKAAIALDDLALQMAKHAATIDAQYSAFNESRSAGAGGYFTPVSGSTLAKLALDRAVAAQAGEWIESRPSAKDAAARVVGAVMAVTA